MKKKFSLKDHLFNRPKIEFLATLIKKAHPTFKNIEFTERTVQEFPKLELKERIAWVRRELENYLPEDYRAATKILLKSLPPENDPNKTDDDFGDFIFAPVNNFVAANGCNKKDLKFSLKALKETTKRFSAEDAVRNFLNSFPKETLATMEMWSTDKNYHVRRLASEGTRPNLPWSHKVSLDHGEVISKILDNLYFDPTRYVVRSVANHLNDISKESPTLVVATLKRWQKEGKQNEKEMEYLTVHALRTLVKNGNPEALKLLGFHRNPKISIQDFIIDSKTVTIGGEAHFSFIVIAKQDEKLMIDYILHFQGKKGDLRPKVFKIKQRFVHKGKRIAIEKKHPLRKMTTKKLYPGEHQITLQINGKEYNQGKFTLKK